MEGWWGSLFNLSFPVPQSHLFLADHLRSITEKTKKNMSGKISREEVEEMREIFRKIGELTHLIQTFNLHPSSSSPPPPHSQCALVFKWHVCASTDLDNDNHICDHELHELLKNAGHDLPGYMFREIMVKLDRNQDNKISFDEFLAVCKTDSPSGAGRSSWAFPPQWVGLCFVSWPVSTSPSSTGPLALRNILASACTAAALKSRRKKPHAHTHTLKECGSEVSKVVWVPVFCFSREDGAVIKVE